MRIDWGMTYVIIITHEDWLWYDVSDDAVEGSTFLRTSLREQLTERLEEDALLTPSLDVRPHTLYGLRETHVAAPTGSRLRIVTSPSPINQWLQLANQQKSLLWMVAHSRNKKKTLVMETYRYSPFTSSHSDTSVTSLWHGSEWVAKAISKWQINLMQALTLMPGVTVQDTIHTFGSDLAVASETLDVNAPLVSQTIWPLYATSKIK